MEITDIKTIEITPDMMFEAESDAKILSAY